MPLFRSDDPWRIVWRVVTSDYLLGLVCLALALALLLAAWLPQMSGDGATFDATWHAEVQRRFGEEAWFDALRTPLQRVGAFDVAEAAWVRLVLALLVLILWIRFIERAERFWLGWQREPPPQDAHWSQVEDAGEDLIQRLQQRHFRIVEGRDSETNALTWVRVDRWPWGNLGPLAVYFGGLLVLAGVVVTALWGWQTETLPLTAGESVPLEQGSDLVLYLESLTPDGQRGVGEIRREAGPQVSAGELALGAPLSGGGVGAYLVGNGSALRVQATSTHTLELAEGPGRETQEQLVLTFTQEDPRRLVGVPEAGLVLLLAMAQPPDLEAGLQVQAFESGSGQLVSSLEAFTDTRLVVGNVSFTLEPTPYADVRVIRDPGAFWSQLGMVFLLMGGLLWMAWPPRCLWLRPGSGEADADADWSDDVAVARGMMVLPTGLFKKE